MHDYNLYRAYTRHFPADGATVFMHTPQGRCYTYADVAQLSARYARHLTELGLAPGDRVSVQCEKSPEVVWLYLACLRAGFVFHPLNPGYTPAEVDYFLGDAAPALLIASSALVPTLAPLAARHGVPRVATLNADGTGSFVAACAAAEAAHEPILRDAHDLAALLYSSGTTGRPKGIMLSHRNLATNAESLTRAWGFEPGDVLLHMLPIFHVHGLFIALGCVLMSGSQLIFSPRFEVDEALRWLPKASVFMGVPTYYTRLLAASGLDASQCRAIRLFTSGSAPLLAETWTQFAARTGHEIVERYGMTETSIIATNPLVGERRPGSVGPALPGVEVRVVDDAGRALACGETGHVQVRGDSVFEGYWRLPDKTRDDFTADGFFNTGDDGVLDAGGYLTLVGRAKDLIISGGLNVYPSEVESVLDELPEVAESAVVGVPHPDFGEQVVAALVLRPGTQWDEGRARSDVRERLASYKCPKQYRILDELPRNAMGKVQKTILRTTWEAG